MTRALLAALTLLIATPASAQDTPAPLPTSEPAPAPEAVPTPAPAPTKEVQPPAPAAAQPPPAQPPAALPDTHSAAAPGTELPPDAVREGLAHYRAGRSAEAAAAFRRALQASPSDAGLFGWLGMALLQGGQLSQARAALQRAVELEPNVANHHLRLGRAHQALGHHDAARLSYGRALRLSPSHAEARRALADLGPGAPHTRPPPRDERAPARSTEPPRTRSYAPALTAAYVGAPLVALGLGALLQSEAALIVFLAPPVVHAAHGNVGPALLSPVGMTGLTLLGGYALGSTTSCSNFGCIGPIMLGATLGYAGWAIIDIMAFSSVERAGPSDAALRKRSGEPPARRGIAGPLAGAGAGLALGALTADSVVCEGECNREVEVAGAVLYSLVSAGLWAVVGDGTAAAIEGDRTRWHVPVLLGVASVSLLGGLLLGDEALDRADFDADGARERALDADLLLGTALVAGAVAATLTVQGLRRGERDGGDGSLTLAPMLARGGAGLQLSWRQ